MSRRPHPAPSVIARYLHRLADLLADQGPRAVERSRVLASRGWPEATNGNGSRSADTTSSTERSALDPGPWDGIDLQLATDLRLLWFAATTVENRVGRVLSHASDDDQVPPGTGHCKRCNELVRPTKTRPHHRIISGWCPACRIGWYRWRERNPDGTRSDYDRTFKESAA